MSRIDVGCSHGLQIRDIGIGGGNWKTFKDLPHFEKKSIKTKTSEIKTSWRNLIKLPKIKQATLFFKINFYHDEFCRYPHLHLAHNKI